MLPSLIMVSFILSYFRGVSDVQEVYLIYQRYLRSVSDVPEVFVKCSEMFSERPWGIMPVSDVRDVWSILVCCTNDVILSINV